MATGARLAIGAAVMLGVTVYMAYVGASSSWQYYLTVDECMANASTLLNSPIRVSGKIALNSLHLADDRSEASFLLQGANGGLRVKCSGQLPDNLAEERHVVVEGQMNDNGLLVGHKLLSRCASKYASQQRSPPSENSHRRGSRGS